MWIFLATTLAIFFSCLNGLVDGYVYCDPFSQAKMLRCVCSLLDYSDIHHYTHVFTGEPLLCQRYADYHNCTKDINPICRRSVVGHLDNVYDVLCVKIQQPCKFIFNVDLSYCPLKPLCPTDSVHCYINHGSVASIMPTACGGYGLLLHSSTFPNGTLVTIPGPADATFTCTDGSLIGRGFAEMGGVYSGITQISCAPSPFETCVQDCLTRVCPLCRDRTFCEDYCSGDGGTTGWTT